MTECNQQVFSFHSVGRRDVEARFDGGRMTSDGGALLLREVERRIGAIAGFAACFKDYRDPDLIEHSIYSLVAQRIYGLALGYEDHHSNKPPKPDQRGGTRGNGDFMYLGSGSAELANWARCALTIGESTDGLFELRGAKRGARSGLTDKAGNLIAYPYRTFIQHSTRGICWEQADYNPSATKEDLKALQVNEVLTALGTRAVKAGELEAVILKVTGHRARSTATDFIAKHLKDKLQKSLGTGLYTVKPSVLFGLSGLSDAVRSDTLSDCPIVRP